MKRSSKLSFMAWGPFSAKGAVWRLFVSRADLAYFVPHSCMNLYFFFAPSEYF